MSMNKGRMMESCGEWLARQYVEDANKTVTMKLDAVRRFIKSDFYYTLLSS